MSMYECAECGDDHGDFPEIMLAVNQMDNVYPYHRSELELKFNELYGDKPVGHYDSDNWKRFWSWLGDEKILWFCSISCAVSYLVKVESVKRKT